MEEFNEVHRSDLEKDIRELKLAVGIEDRETTQKQSGDGEGGSESGPSAVALRSGGPAAGSCRR